MQTLIIDNFDSFTWNLASYVAEVSGSTPTVIRNNEPGWDVDRIAAYDAVIVSPGPGHPATPRDTGFCLDVIRDARTPVLGVCLGHQAIAHVHGGHVGSAPEPVHGQVRQIRHDGSELFDGLPTTFSVVRYHSLIVEELPDELAATAWTDDGLIMALRHRTLPQWGVQFHPESIGGEHGHAIVANFLRLAKEWGSRPRWRLHNRTVDVEADAAAVHHALFAESEHSFWLDSTSPDLPSGRFSYLGDASGPYARVVEADVDAQFDVFDRLARSLAANTIEVGDDVEFGFTLGWVGYLGYELKAQCGSSNAHSSPHPDLALIFADRAVVIDHRAGRVHLLALFGSEHDAEQLAWCEETATRLTELAPAPARPIGEVGALRLRHGRPEYLERIDQCLDQIRLGETYEVCLTNKLSAPGRLRPAAAYRELRAANPSPFGALLRFGELSVLSSSPERFLTVDRSGHVESRPIKGTRPRSSDPGRDRELREDLARNPKDRAENRMIVDLVRNDLARCAVPGSVEAPRLFEVESYATVHQLVSTITAQLADGATSVDAVRAAFPGGSMTGAPKLRTMELIDKLEDGPRGVYSGALGYFSLDGAMDLSMVIRTIVADGDAVSYGVGGAILALSDPVEEFAETVTKARPLTALLGQDFPA